MTSGSLGATARSLLLVEPPGPRRDGLLRVASSRAIAVDVCDDAMQLLGRLDGVVADVVLVGERPGAPGPASLCRILERRLNGSRVHRLGDPAESGPLGVVGQVLPASLTAEELVARMWPALAGEEYVEPGLEESPEAQVGPLQFPRLLLACADAHYSGRLWVRTPAAEREVVLLSGMPVMVHGTGLEERLGAIAIDLGLVEPDSVAAALAHTRIHGGRCGEALLALGALDGLGLHQALSEQVLARLATLCAVEQISVRFVAEPGIAGRETLLRVHPLTAMARAMRAVPQVARTAAAERLGPLPIEPCAASRTVERFLAAFGVLDLAALLQHARSFQGLVRLLAPSLSRHAPLTAEVLALLLLWSGVLRVRGTDTLGPWPEQPGLPLERLATLPPFQGLKGGAPGAVVASNDESEPRPLPEPLRNYLFGGGQRGAYAWEGPAVEGAPELAAFLARYYSAKGQSDPLRLLGITLDSHQGKRSERPLRPEAVRRAYLAALSDLDGLPQAPDPLALAAKRFELREAYERAYQQLVRHGLGSVPPESQDPPAVAVQQLQAAAVVAANPPHEVVSPELERLLTQGRYRELAEHISAMGGSDLERLPAPLRVLFAVALRELPASAGVRPAGLAPEGLCIAALAELFQLPRGHALVLMLSKRVLRSGARGAATGHSFDTLGNLLVGVVAGLALAAGVIVGLWAPLGEVLPRPVIDWLANWAALLR